MALNGSFSGGIRSNKYKLRVDWSATQSVENNTSVITCTMYLVQASGFDLYISGRSNTTTINGTSKSWSSPAISGAAGKTTKLGTVTSGAITHNADGTKSVTIKAVFNVRATISGTYYETITAEDTITLNTIPRATTPTLSASTVGMGNYITISTPRASSAFTHDLAYSFAGGGYTSIATGVGTSYAWVVPDLASEIPNSTSGTVIIRCTTKNGETVLGTKVVTFTAQVPANVKPTVTVALAPVDKPPFHNVNAYYAGVSSVKIISTGTGAKGSTIKAYSVEFNGRVYNANSISVDAPLSSGSYSIVAKVKDSRGRWSNTVTKTIGVLPYNKPKINNFQIYRTDSQGLETPDSDHLTISYNYIANSVKDVYGAECNYVIIKHQFFNVAENKWDDLAVWNAGEAPLSDIVHLRYPGFSSEQQYDIRVVITDALGNVAEYTATLPTAEVLMDFRFDGSAVAFGKVSEKSDVYEFGKAVEFQGPVYGTAAGLGTLPRIFGGDDFNEYKEIGSWGVYGNTDAKYMVNMPVQVAGKLEVSAATGEGIRGTEWSYLKQKFIPYRTEYPTYERDVSRDASNVWTFGEWVPTTLTGKKVLWGGAWYMSSAQTATLSEAISRQNNGIILVFCRFNADTNTADNGNYNSFFVHKELVKLHSGAGHCFQMNAVNYSTICSKYLYISDLNITGNDLNTAAATSPNGVTYNNATYVLRYVIGV